MDEPFIVPMTTTANTDVCFQLTILGDSVCEESELFSVRVTAVNPLDTLSGPVVADVTIFDNGDSESVGTSYHNTYIQ